MPTEKKKYKRPNQLIFRNSRDTNAISWHPNFDSTEADKASLIHINKEGSEQCYVHVPFPCMKAFVSIFCKLNNSGYHQRFNIAYFLGAHETDNRVVTSFLVYNRRVIIKMHKWSLKTLIIIDKKHSERETHEFKHNREDPDEIGRHISKLIRGFRNQHRRNKYERSFVVG